MDVLPDAGRELLRLAELDGTRHGPAAVTNSHVNHLPFVERLRAAVCRPAFSMPIAKFACFFAFGP